MTLEVPVDIVDRFPEPHRRIDCDACDHKAHVEAVTRITLTNGGQLHFCSHHSNRHQAALQAKGAKIRPLP